MAGIDRTSPGFVVQILAAGADPRIGGRADPGGAPGRFLDKMTDVSIRVEKFEYIDDERGFAKLSLTVDNFDLYFFDHPAWQVGNLVRFFWGYPGRIQGPKYAIVDNRRGFQKLEISCTEQASISNEAKNRQWTNMTRSEIVNALVKEGAFGGVSKVDVDDGIELRKQAAAAHPDAATRAALQQEIADAAATFSAVKSEKPRDWTQSRQTDWQFALRLAEEVGFELYVEDDVLHFHPRRLASVPVRRYEWYTGAGDLLSFDVEEWRALDRAGVVQVAGRDPIERTNLSSTGSNATTKRDVLGNQGTSAQKTISRVDKTGKLLVGTKIVPSPRTDPTAISNLADAQFRALEQGEVQAHAVVIGDPALKAKQIVELVGVSRVLSGNYHVQKASHRIDGSGYQTALEIIRNAVTNLPSGAPDLDRTKTKDNDQKIPVDKRKKVVRDPITGVLKQV